MSSDPPSELLSEDCDADELITLEVEAKVSAVARHPSVRAWMRERQRELGAQNGAVMEGRDIGTVVFTDAPVKLFLRADQGLRADRRAEERTTHADDAEQLVSSLKGRDARDARTTPLEPAPAAQVIDTSSLSAEATVDQALAIVRELAPWLAP